MTKVEVPRPDPTDRRPPNYDRHFFDADSIEKAKSLVLMDEEGMTSEERWARETPSETAQIMEWLNPGPDDLLLDYGCGVGRLARSVMAASQCSVLGIDTNRSMRALAARYVESERFSAISRQTLLAMQRHGLKCDHAVSVWVLQHCIRPAEDIKLVWNCLTPGGRFYVVNTFKTFIPTDRGWINNGTDITSLLAERFRLLHELPLPEGVFEERVSEHFFMRLYEKAQ